MRAFASYATLALRFEEGLCGGRRVSCRASNSAEVIEEHVPPELKHASATCTLSPAGLDPRAHTVVQRRSLLQLPSQRPLMDRRVIGERSDAVLRTTMPGDDTAVVVRDGSQLENALVGELYLASSIWPSRSRSALWPIARFRRAAWWSTRPVNWPRRWSRFRPFVSDAFRPWTCRS